MNKMELKIREILDEAVRVNHEQPQVAKDLCFRAMKIAKEEDNYQMQGEVYLQLIKAYRLMSSYEDALDCADSARKIFTALRDDEGLMRLNNLIGVLYFYNGIYELALRHLDVSYLSAERLNNKRLMMATLNNIGEVKKKAGDLNEAMEIYNKSLEMAKDNKLSVYYGVIIQNIGDVHMLRGELEKAEKCFHEAYSSFVEESETANLSELFLNLGRLYLKQNDPERARSYFETAIVRLEKVQNKFYILDALIEMHKLDKIENPELALSHLIKARKLASQGRIELKLSEIELHLNKYYEEESDYERALYHFKRYHNIVQKLEANNLILKLKILKLEKMSGASYDSNQTVYNIVNDEIELEKEKLKTLEKINSDLTYQAFYDNLTKLANRHKIDKELNKISRRTNGADKGQSLGIFMLDIDHFKLVNDHMGHLFGDKCLESIGETLEKLADKYNAFVGRYGGEEFIFIKEKLDLFTANSIAHELNQAVRKLNIFYKIGKEDKRLTISVGGLYCESIRTFDKLSVLELADKALYIAKAEGRDKAVLHVHECENEISLTNYMNA